MIILVADPIDSKGIEVLKNAGFEVFFLPENFEEILPKVDGLIVRASGRKIDRNLLGRAKNLKVIGLASTGHDTIDLDAATEAGVVVLGQPDNKDIDVSQHGNFISVAEHTIGLMIAVSKHIAQADHAMKRGYFPKKELGPQGQELYGKVLGIIGFGRIGKLVCRRALAFGIRVIACDPYLSEREIKEAEDLGVSFMDLDTLLSTSDYITVHVPKNSETVNLISENEFTKMKDGVIIINCARGGIIDEKALLEALDNKIAGAGLDVFTEEPPESELLKALVNHQKVIATPHIAGPTKESLQRFSTDVSYGIIKFLKEGILIHPLNANSINERRFLELEPYRVLGKTLTKILLELWKTSKPKLDKIEIEYYGQILAEPECKIVTGSLLKEAMRILGGDRANYVNARFIAEEQLGIVILEEVLIDEAPEYSFLLRIYMTFGKQRKSIAGTILGKRGARIVEIDDYMLEARPSEKMIVIENEDRPGVIGMIGTILGQNAINIAHFHLGRIDGTRRALAIINIDNDVSKPVLDDLTAIEWVKSAHFIKI